MTEISPKAYVAAAINQVRRVPGIEPGMKGREIAKVAIIGAGLMGSGIAVCFLGAGIPTVAAFGPGRLPLAHSPNEHIAVESLGQAAQVYALCALNYLGEGGTTDIT